MAAHASPRAVAGYCTVHRAMACPWFCATGATCFEKLFIDGNPPRAIGSFVGRTNAVRAMASDISLISRQRDEVSQISFGAALEQIASCFTTFFGQCAGPAFSKYLI